jgi:septal ring factor EnvC (AmiA/AmiB activator)
MEANVDPKTRDVLDVLRDYIRSGDERTRSNDELRARLDALADQLQRRDEHLAAHQAALDDFARHRAALDQMLTRIMAELADLRAREPREPWKDTDGGAA